MTTRCLDGAIRFGANAKRFAGLLVPGMNEIRRHRPVLPPLIAAWFFSFASAYAMRTYVVMAMPVEQAQYAEALVWLGAMVGPLLNGLKALLLAAFAWGILVLANADRSIRSIFSVLLYGEAILAAQGIVIALFLRLATDGSAPSLQDLQTSLGLAALVPTTRPVLAAAAQNATLLHATWFAFLFVGFQRVADLGPWSAAGLAVLFWCILIGLGAARFLVL